MARHGIYATEVPTSVSIPVAAQSGLPFVIGAAPIQCAEHPAAVGVPVLVRSYSEFVDKFGYSDDWEKYDLCEFAYSHFVLYGRQPVIFVNLLAPATMNTSVAASDVTCTDNKAELPFEAINDATLVVKASGGQGSALVKGTAYDVYYANGKCIVEALGSSPVSALNIAYKKVTPNSVTDAEVATGLESIEMCATTVGEVPDLICAPGHSSATTVAAVMAAKAGGINGVFEAKALVDIDVNDATTVAGAISEKANSNLSDENMIVCWPQLTNGGKTFHFSTLLAGLMAEVDADNGGFPVETPSNKGIKCDGMVAGSTTINLTHAQGNTLNAAGIVTALNNFGGWIAWGNYTGCYPGNADVKDSLIPVSRMIGCIRNTIVKTAWTKLDKPMNRLLLDSIVDGLGIWLNGLIGSGYLLGGRVDLDEGENPVTDLMQGIVRFHVYATPPSPMQEVNFVLEYDASYVVAAFS